MTYIVLKKFYKNGVFSDHKFFEKIWLSLYCIVDCVLRCFVKNGLWSGEFEF